MKKQIWIVLIAMMYLFTACQTLKKERTVNVPKTVNEQTKMEKSAKKAYESSDYTETISQLKALLKKDPKNPVYWGQLGSCYAQLNEFDYSIYAYQSAIKHDPRNVKAMYNLSVVYAEKGSSQDAKNILDRALKLDPKNPLLQASLGNVLIDEQNYDKAKVLYERIVNVKPDFDIGHFNLGVINYQERNLPEAEKNYLEVLRINPKDFEAKQNLSAINILKQDYVTAVRYLKEVIDANPPDDITLENSYYNLGVAYLRMKRFKESLSAFETAITIEPWDMAAYVNCAILSEQLGLKEKAVKYWEKYDHLLPINKRKKEMKKRIEDMGAKSDDFVSDEIQADGETNTAEASAKTNENTDSQAIKAEK
ncbi:MAG: tetratricopeptide repeat protein [bacterium]